MIYAYDTEYLDRGPDQPIALISIGVVAADGRELYAVNADIDLYAIHQHDWLTANVCPHLPILPPKRGYRGANVPRLDTDHPDVRRPGQIARLVRDFLLPASTAPTCPVQLWTDCGGYGHVLLQGLFRGISPLPPALPTFTHELQQETQRQQAALPEQVTGANNALADARHIMTCLRHLGIASAHRSDT